MKTKYYSNPNNANVSYTNWCRSQPQPQPASSTQINWCVDKTQGQYPDKSMYNIQEPASLPSIVCCANIIGNTGKIEDVSQRCSLNIQKAYEILSPVSSPPSSNSLTSSPPPSSNTNSPPNNDDIFQSVVWMSCFFGSMILFFLIVMLLVFAST